MRYLGDEEVARREQLSGVRHAHAREEGAEPGSAYLREDAAQLTRRDGHPSCHLLEGEWTRELALHEGGRLLKERGMHSPRRTPPAGSGRLPRVREAFTRRIPE
jgi:hypothetical protein